MSRFIRCVCDDDLSALVVEGNATPDELAEAWNKIYTEYIGLSADAGSRHSMAVTFEIEALRGKITIIDTCVEVLRSIRDDRFVKVLHSLGYNFPYNEKDFKQYHKDLDRVVNRSKSLIVQIEDKERELEILNKKQSSGGKVTREYFENVLINLSDHAKYQLNEDTLTVSSYCLRLNRYVKHCEQLNNQANAKRSHR